MPDDTAIAFRKYEAAGNDFVLLEHPAIGGDWPAWARALCDRCCGIGADHLLVLRDDPAADTRLEIHNRDGSRADTCGNGLRAVALHLALTREPRDTWRIALGDGVVTARHHGDAFATNLGRPSSIEQGAVTIGAARLDLACVTIGNPHAIAFSEMPGRDAHRLGPLVATHRQFPDGTNAHFIRRETDGRFEAVSWERGAGPTRACGSGAAAIAAVLSNAGEATLPLDVRFPGGTLRVERDDAGDLWVGGPATLVFDGHYRREMSASC